MASMLYNEDCIEGMPRCVDSETVDLVIADPPYFKVAGKQWDYQWRTLEDYLVWSEKWLEEVFRVLRYGGSFYLFGYFRTLAHMVSILEKMGFSLRQQIVINKGMKAVGGRHTKPYKMFPNATESVLFLVKNPRPFSAKLLKDRQKTLGLTAKEINEALGVKSNGGGMWSIYTGRNVCEQLPTVELWEKLQKILQFEYPYEKLGITFNAEMGLTDVWDDIDFYAERNTRIHPTQKPEKLIERLVLASSREGDLVLDPFMGSGTTAVCAQKHNRRWVGFETEADYYEQSMKRISSRKKLNHPVWH